MIKLYLRTCLASKYKTTYFNKDLTIAWFCLRQLYNHEIILKGNFQGCVSGLNVFCFKFSEFDFGKFGLSLLLKSSNKQNFTDLVQDPSPESLTGIILVCADLSLISVLHLCILILLSTLNAEIE